MDQPDDAEAIELARVPFLGAAEQGKAGRIQDMISLALMLRAYHMAREGQPDEPMAKAMLAKAGRTP